MVQKSAAFQRNENDVKKIEAKFIQKAQRLLNVKDMSLHISMPQGWYNFLFLALIDW